MQARPPNKKRVFLRWCWQLFQISKGWENWEQSPTGRTILSRFFLLFSTVILLSGGQNFQRTRFYSFFGRILDWERVDLRDSILEAEAPRSVGFERLRTRGGFERRFHQKLESTKVRQELHFLRPGRH